MRCAPVRQNTRKVLDDAAAGDVCGRVHIDACEQRLHGLDIDMCWRHQGIDQRHAVDQRIRAIQERSAAERKALEARIARLEEDIKERGSGK